MPNSDLLISCGNDPVIRLWDRNTGQSLGELWGHERAVEAIALSTDGTTLASASSDETVRLWDVPSRSQRRVLFGHKGRVATLAFSPDGNDLATGSLDKTVRVCGVATGDLSFKAARRRLPKPDVFARPAANWRREIGEDQPVAEGRPGLVGGG